MTDPVSKDKVWFDWRKHLILVSDLNTHTHTHTNIVFVILHQNKRTNRKYAGMMYIKEIYYKALAHVIIVMGNTVICFLHLEMQRS